MMFKPLIRVVTCAALPLLPFLMVAARAQAPAEKPKFEVASVRRVEIPDVSRDDAE